MRRTPGAAGRAARASAVACGLACAAAAGAPRALAAQAPADPALPSVVRAASCAPCEVALAPGGATWRLDVVADTAGRAAGERTVRALRVARAGSAPVALALAPPVTLGADEEFVVGVMTLGAVDAPAVFFSTDPGAANARAQYWLVGRDGRVAPLGRQAMLATGSGGRICSYERGGEGGLLFTQTEFRLHDDALRPVRQLRVEAAGRPNAYRVVRRAWGASGGPQSRSAVVRRGAAERIARGVDGPCPAGREGAVEK